MKKVAKIIWIVVLVLVVLLVALVACVGGDETTELTPQQIEEIESGENAEIYRDMLENLDVAFAEKTDELISEFKAESVYVAGDTEALEELGESKLDELLDMQSRNEEMLEKQITDRGGSDAEVEYWCGQLEEIAKNYGFKIMKLYE